MHGLTNSELGEYTGVRWMQLRHMNTTCEQSQVMPDCRHAPPGTDLLLRSPGAHVTR
jgi:hypothetical protein